jgi:hypothetical protein
MAQLINDLFRTLNTPQLRWLDPWITLNHVRIRKGVNILTLKPDSIEIECGERGTPLM